MNYCVMLLAILPVASGSAQSTAQPDASAPEGPKKIPLVEVKDLSVGYLAHSFFVHHANHAELLGIISEAGVNRIEPEIAAIRQEMADVGRMAPEARQLCTNLASAKSGHEFATVLTDYQESKDEEMEEHAVRILSKLDINDRTAVETYLDTSVRPGIKRALVDYHAMYSANTFPSPESKMILDNICDTASQAEAAAEAGAKP